MKLRKSGWVFFGAFLGKQRYWEMKDCRFLAHMVDFLKGCRSNMKYEAGQASPYDIQTLRLAYCS